jgi:alpha-L-fucosidase
MFLHFNMGTFHDAEWVEPNQDPASFAPTELDCGQWADAAKAASMRFAVLTAKHHDGFCLWPSAYTDYGVMSSSYRHDVVREYVSAFRRRGITPCLYFSIWDRTNGVGPAQWDDPWTVTREQIELVKGQLTELLTGYGPIPLLIFDGWAWHPSLGHRTVPFGEIRTHVASLQPDCLVLDLNGLTVPWDSDLLFIEEPKGGVFCPADNSYAASQGQTIVPTGWFWHPNTPTVSTMTVEEIVGGHLDVLEPRWCTFILNCPPNDKGRLDDNIVETLHGVGERWRPDATRPPLPPQPDQLRRPLTPVSAIATSGDAEAAIDGHSDFGWNGQADQTLWTSDSSLPQAITLDLGRVHQGIDTVTYLPRQDAASPWTYSYVTDGNITSYRVSASVDGQAYRVAASGPLATDHALKTARFDPIVARYLRLEALATVGGGPAIASEIGCGRTG